MASTSGSSGHDPSRLDEDNGDEESKLKRAGTARQPLEFFRPKRRFDVMEPLEFLRLKRHFNVMARVPPKPPRKPVPRVHNTAGKRFGHPSLTADALYVTVHHRPPITAPRNGHKCQICQLVKSHPVLAGCGHSYCFVCIRLRLEREWACPYPDCGRIMRSAPTRDWASADAIKADYVARVDLSRVSYSWEGLEFPLCPLPFYVSSSP
ncbi:hypothetical protein R3P38DRAFT_3173221 [Favolaschia claudopus]|uniref:RING-type domain-containing protein n=1 Tax=Favolaschia claudopus TaxID=2862362 RepID=A0AAW0DIG9_9AGAR